MSFRTSLIPVQGAFSITHKDHLLLIGSCFTEHIGQKLETRKFNTLQNSFGIVYNPVSMALSLKRIAKGDSQFTQEDLFEQNGLWHSWEHHGRFSQPDPNETLKGINAAYQTAVDHWKRTEVLFLTLGTAEVFSLRENGQVVANNHKMPSAHFDSRRLSVSEIVAQLGQALEGISNKQVILTVSPVRHLRSGLIENQRSKAALILACEELCRHLPGLSYFPAYELLQDDLRDYRFYAADMVHPSEVALEYVWQYFSETYFSEKTRQWNERIEKIQAAARHRPFHPDTEQHRAFARTQLETIDKLYKEAPELDFSAEKAIFFGYL